MTDRRTDSENGRSPDWYYRLGERERGPMTLEEIKDLVAASGETARTVSVRQHADGAWMPYESIDAVTAGRRHADRPNPSPPATVRPIARPGGGGGRQFSSRLSKQTVREVIRRNRPIVVGVVVLAAVNGLLWYLLDPFYTTERRYLTALAEAAKKAHDARTNGLDAGERAKIAKSVVQDMKPMVEALKKTANASQPIRQHLLWAADNQLPKLFAGNSKELDQSDAIFQRHLYEAGRLMGIEMPQPETSVVFK